MSLAFGTAMIVFLNEFIIVLQVITHYIRNFAQLLNGFISILLFKDFVDIFWLIQIFTLKHIPVTAFLTFVVFLFGISK